MNSRKLACFLLAVLAAGDVHSSISPASTRARTIEIDYETDTFLMDGEPFQYVAGSMHYFRSPHENWREKLRAMRAAGLNAVTTYVEWGFHEREYRQYKWTGDKDLVKFIETAQEEDLYVILRPGPYISAGRELGGFPYWLLGRYPGIKLRTKDSNFMSEVGGWFTQLMPKIRSLLYGNGGPIILIQVENDYGTNMHCDRVYMTFLSELLENWVRGDALLFTTDQPSYTPLDCGSVPGAYPTVSFGTGENSTAAWENMRKFSPRGPLVNSELHTGWVTHWGENAITVSAAAVVQTMEEMFAVNASFNLYMFHGGTDFGFSGGAFLIPTYSSDITSYDYDAPLTEAGDPTPKYMAIRDTIGKYMPLPDLPVPTVKPKGAYGVLLMNPILDLLNDDGRARLGTKVTISNGPQTMESLGQFSGLILYEAVIPEKRHDPSMLHIRDLRDRAMVYLNRHLTGVLSRSYNIYHMPIMAAQGNHLQVLVENEGRVNYKTFEDYKGIQGDILLTNNVISNWTITNFPLEIVESAVEDLSGQNMEDATVEGLLRDGPIMYRNTFTLSDANPLDTYLDMSGWGKGFVWLNNINLGRYWPDEGPQITLFVPGLYFHPPPLNNTLIVLELQHGPKNFAVQFVDTPILGLKRGV